MSQDTQNGVILDCSWVVFDWDRFISDNPYSLKEIIDTSHRSKLDVKEQIGLGYKVSKDTLQWWNDQGSEAKKKILPSTNDVSINTFMIDFIESLRGVNLQYFWSRSNTFDPIILERLARDNGSWSELSNILKFWIVRDTRTYIDAKTNFNRKMNSFIPISDENYWNETFIKHDSRCDIAADILRLQTLTRIDNDLDPTEK